MIRFLKTSAILALVTVFIPIGIQAQEKDYLAKIGNKKITLADFKRIISYYDQEQQKVIDKNPQLKETILWQIVQGSAISKIARDKGFDKRAEIKSQQELLVNNFLATQYLQKEVIEKVTINDAKARAYYKDNPETFKTPETVRARHILVKTEPTVTEEDKKKLKEKAGEILEKLKKGEDFAKLAGELSDDPGTKTKGGDLGFFPKGSMISAFEEAAFALKPGGLSAIVETEYGYHIIKLEEKKEALLEPYDKIKDKVKDQALQELRKKAVNDFIENALKSAKVEIRPEGINKPQK